MSYSRVRENTASLWMTKTVMSAEWPGDGQGSSVASINNSLINGASESNPVIIEAILFHYVTSSDPAQITSCRIRDVDNNELLVVNVKPTLAQESQYVAVGGPYGVRVNEPFKVRLDLSGTNALPYNSGAKVVGPVTIFFRYA